MKQLYAVALAAVLTIFGAKAQTTETYFAEYPTLTPDAQTVIFSYEGDLWKVAVNGQTPAVRLTAMQGQEIPMANGLLLAETSMAITMCT
jgi:tricorn protease